MTAPRKEQDERMKLESPRYPLLQQSTDRPDEGQPSGTALLDPESQTQEPRLYKVILLNDDFTPMDFVTLVLKKFFGKSEEQANKIMLDVHKKGAGVAGVYTLEVAEMRSMQANQFARINRHPLKSTLEPES